MTPDWEPSERFDEWPGCLNCAHYCHSKCAAYLDRIPFLIASGQVDHLVDRPGQVPGILFEPMDAEHFLATGERRPVSKAAESAA